MKQSKVRVKPIETHYDGYKFRSRLEARWAVFFNALGIKYEYELEGYDLGEAGWYLPDFYLKNVGLRGQEQGLWAEIKQIRPTETEEHKMIALVLGTKKDGVILIGSPCAYPGELDTSSDGHYQYMLDPGNDGGFWWDNDMAFMKCYNCGLIKIEYTESNYLYCPTCGGRCDFNHAKINAATVKARQARFEHGTRKG